MITISNLTKKYGDKYALDNISFNVKKGEVLGFLGPNGAGKSTTMNIITGYISYTDGSVNIDGYDILENPIEVKKKIGYLPEIPPLYLDMVVWDYLEFVYELKKIKTEDEKSHIQQVIDMVKIDNVKNRKIANLSKGYRQRVGLAGALIGDPEILILDEPTVGLDPKQIIEIRNVIKELGKEKTVILSSHILSEISAVCDRVIIINKGKLVAIDTPENLENKVSNKNCIYVTVEDPEDKMKDMKDKIEGAQKFELIEELEDGTKQYMVESKENVDLRKVLFTELAKENITIFEMKKADSTLEDAFMKIIEGGKN